MKNSKSEQRMGVGDINRRSSSPWWRSMIYPIKNKVSFAIALATMAGSLAAADIKPAPAGVKGPPVSKKSPPAVLTGRIVFVDKSLHALAVDVKGKLLQINFVPYIKIFKSGTTVSFDELAAGQEVSILFRETAEGRLDVVSLTIEGSSSEAEVAGHPKGAKHTGPPDPFPGSANPANLGGPVRSPHH